MEVVGTLSCYLWCKLCVHAQSCPTLCNSMDCSPPGSFVHRIFQARILEWVAISYSTDISYFHSYLIYNNLIKACEIRSAIRNIKIVGMWVLASPFFFFFTKLQFIWYPLFLQHTIQENRYCNTHIQPGHMKNISEFTHFKQSLFGSSCFVVIIFLLLTLTDISSQLYSLVPFMLAKWSSGE